MLSRAFCAGLIEAAGLLLEAGADPKLSRAFCAGLIEAVPAGGGYQYASAVIPCVLRGPH